ncbi:MAG: hypothetical protein ACJ8AO_13480, partial [Gemmatimonadaceae bacterium]
ASQACEAGNRFPCWGKVVQLTQGVPTLNVAGAINTVSVSEPIAGGTLGARTFGEASINLQGSGIFGSGECRFFGSAYLKSRSSNSFTAELKDFIAPVAVNLSTCESKSLDNTARASATNFAPTGGNLGDGIFDTGKIVVTEQTASLNVAPTTVRLAQADGEATAGIVTATELEANDRRAARRTGELARSLRATAATERPGATVTTAPGRGVVT